MRIIRLIVSYEGTAFQGWQSQSQGERTVQDTLESSLRTLMNEPGLHVVGSGRTDTGVHAMGQVASFRTESDRPVDVIERALGAMLPDDLRVLAVDEAPEGFHPQRSAKAKTYLYIIANSNIVSPFACRYAWRIPRQLDIDRMREAAAILVGTHDFRAFMAAGSSVTETVRTLLRLDVTVADGLPFMGMHLGGRFIQIEAEGTGFLRHMVRNIAGTLAETGEGARTVESVRDTLASLDRNTAGATAPAQGLFLKGVRY